MSDAAIFYFFLFFNGAQNKDGMNNSQYICLSVLPKILPPENNLVFSTLTLLTQTLTSKGTETVLFPAK